MVGLGVGVGAGVGEGVGVGFSVAVGAEMDVACAATVVVGAGYVIGASASLLAPPLKSKPNAITTAYPATVPFFAFLRFAKGNSSFVQRCVPDIATACLGIIPFSLKQY